MSRSPLIICRILSILLVALPLNHGQVRPERPSLFLLYTALTNLWQQTAGVKHVAECNFCHKCLLDGEENSEIAQNRRGLATSSPSEHDPAGRLAACTGKYRPNACARVCAVYLTATLGRRCLHAARSPGASNAAAEYHK